MKSPENHICLQVNVSHVKRIQFSHLNCVSNIILHVKLMFSTCLYNRMWNKSEQECRKSYMLQQQKLKLHPQKIWGNKITMKCVSLIGAAQKQKNISTTSTKLTQTESFHSFRDGPYISSSHIKGWGITEIKHFSLLPQIRAIFRPES